MNQYYYRYCPICSNLGTIKPNGYLQYNLTGSIYLKGKVEKHTFPPTAYNLNSVYINSDFENYRNLYVNTFVSGSVELVFRGNILSSTNIFHNFKKPIGNLYISGSLIRSLESNKIVLAANPSRTHQFATGSVSLGVKCISCGIYI